MLLRLRNSYASMNEMVRRQERAANNLANANTVGFKRERSFTEVLREQLDAEGAPSSTRTQTRGADMAQGTMERTGNPLDVALEGDGFFVVSDEATGEPRYTRAGRFTVDADGMLRTHAGLAVEGAEGPLQLQPGAGPITINEDGSIEAGGQTVGRLRVVAFENPGVLEHRDGVTFAAGDQEPTDVDAPGVRQGYVEGSNVDPISQMTEMIEHMRLFESSQKVISTQDEILGKVTSSLGRF